MSDSVKRFRPQALGFLPIVSVFALFVSLVLSTGPALAQSQDSLSALVEAARKSGMEVIIIDPNKQAEAGEAKASAAGAEAMLAARDELIRVLGTLGQAPAEMAATLDRHGGGDGSGWVLIAVLLAIIYLMIGYGGERLFSNWGRQHFMHLFNEVPKDRAEKIGYLIVRAVMMTIGVVVMAMIALVLAALFSGDNEPVWITQRVMITYVFLARLILVMIYNMTAPDAASHRSLTFSDDDAQGIFRGSVIVFTIIGIGVGLCKWMEALGLSPDVHKLTLSLALVVSALCLIVLAFSYRKAIGGAFVSGADPSSLSVTARLFSGNWHVLFTLYVVVATLVSVLRLLLEKPSALGLVTLPILIAVAAIGVYGLGLVFIDRYFERNGIRTIPGEAGGRWGVRPGSRQSGSAASVKRGIPAAVRIRPGPGGHGSRRFRHRRSLGRSGNRHRQPGCETDRYLRGYFHRLSRLESRQGRDRYQDGGGRA